MAQVYLIRVAATNMAAFILDTTDLSTARGASLVLLRAASWVARRALCDALGDDAAPATLSIGASEAVFRIEVADEAVARRAVQAVREALQGSEPDKVFLTKGDQIYEENLRKPFRTKGRDEDGVESRVDLHVMRHALRHATFVVAAVPQAQPNANDPLAFLTAQEQALAAARWRQMHSPSLTVPDLVGTGNGQDQVGEICEIDRMRPAMVERHFRDSRETGDGKQVSLSVATRRRFGWRQKQKFYLDEIKEGRDEIDAAMFFGLSAVGGTDHPMSLLKDEFEAASEGLLEHAGWLEADDGKGTSGEGWLRQDEFFRTGEGQPNLAFDLGQITDCAGFGDLSGKMAVLYADGNGFGAIQRRILRAASDSADRLELNLQGTVEGTMQLMDHLMRIYRRRLLSTVLYEGFRLDDPQWVRVERLKQAKSCKEARTVRLETLLWGGDELLWVMPAWLGFRIAELMMAQVEGHCPRDIGPPDGARSVHHDRAGPWTLDGNRLHVAAGLVFCSHKSPIARVQELSRRLADSTKAIDRGRSLMAVEVLESFDHLGNEPEKQRDRRCPPGISSIDLVLDGQHLTAFMKAFAKFKKADPPRRRLKAVLSGLHDGQPVEGLREQYLSGLSSDMRCQLTIAFDRMVELVGNPIAVWVHLDQFWDYLEPDFDAELETGS